MRLLTVSVLVILSLACLLASVPATFSNSKHKAVLLRDVQSLVFTKDAFTQARRSSPIPQMTCKKGPGQYAPATAFCKNIGFDGVDVNWQCEAELPKGVKLTSAVVSCEGFAHSDDPYVLAGSCGLEYSLEGHPIFVEEVRTPVQGQQGTSWWSHPIQSAKETAHSAANSIWHSSPLGWVWNEWNRPRGINAHANPHNHRYGYYSNEKHEEWSMFPSLGSLVSIVAICVIIFSIIKRICPSPDPAYLQQRRTSWPLSAIYDIMPSNTAPPPYGAHQKSPGVASSIPQQPASSGLWKGLVGGALGYMLGSRSRPNAAPYPSQSWENPRPSFTTDSHSYYSASQQENHLPSMSVRDNEERMLSANSAKHRATDSDNRTTETSSAYGTTKRR